MNKISIFILSFVVFSACHVNQSSSERVPEPDWQERISSEIQNLMAEQIDCWNDGDIECFMKHYWNSDELMFIGKSGVTYGWQQTLENYKTGYPDKKAMGILSFDVLHIDPIDENNTFLVGKWHLKREDGDLEGHYTLLWKKNTDGAWVIVADHSS